MTDALTLHATKYAAGERHAPHWHAELQLSLVLGGALTESAGSRSEVALPLSVAVKDAGVVHYNQFGPQGAWMVRLDLPAGTLADLLDQPGREGSWFWRHDPAVAGPFLRLVGRATSTCHHFATDDGDVVDLLAGLTGAPDTAAGRPPAWLAELVRRLEAEWAPGLTVAAVAAWAHVHPVYLARTFRRHFGTGVAEQLRRLRLRHATAALLADQHDVAHVAPVANVANVAHVAHIAHIAHEAGFADEAHFSRTFRALAGLAPGRFRRQLGALPFAVTPAPRGTSGTRRT